MKYRGQRWVRIFFRTVHLLSVMFLAGAVFGKGETDPTAVAVVVMSGGALVGDEFLRYGYNVLRWASFWAFILKVCLLLFGTARPEFMPEVMIGAVIVGAIISHAPGNVRQFAFVGEPGPCALREQKKAQRQKKKQG